MDQWNAPLIQVLKDELVREYGKIEKAETEIIKIKLQLLDLGVELPLDE